MAELYWRSTPYALSPAAEAIGYVYDACVQGMEQLGYKGVQHQQDIHGYKPGIDLFAAIQFLPNGGGPQFWQVIAVGGGSATAAQAQAEIDQLANMIAGFEWL
jgi:hypothetical protein